MTEQELLRGLNPEQLQAVTKTVKKSALVLAPAGSGKTGVLVKRIAYLIKFKGVDPKNIMAVTFTKKAANEMQKRVEALIGPDAKGITIGTFHSICSQILRKHAKDVGLDKNFTIADTADQKDLLKKICVQVIGDSRAEVVRTHLGMISDLKNKLVRPADAYAVSKDKNLAKIYQMYQDRMQKNNMVDFDDLLFKVANLLEHDAQARAYYQKRFKYVMVDEYQDTNPCQYTIIKKIVGDTAVTGNNLFVVGDDSQSIYSWRGADISNIFEFQKDYPDSVLVTLVKNYRSTKTIVTAGNHVIKNNKRKLDKKAETDNAQGSKIKVNECRSDLDEAQFVVAEIKSLCKFANHKHSDFAILYRSNYQSQVLEKEFVKQRVPYQIVGSVGFYERMEIKDTLAYLRIIVNPMDDIAMKRVLGLHPGIGKTTVTAIEQHGNDNNLSFMEAMKAFVPTRVATRAALQDLRDLLNNLYLVGRVTASTMDKGSLTDLLRIIWERTNYYNKLRDDGSQEALDRIENLKELAKVAKVYQETSDNPTLVEFLQETSLQSEQNKKVGDCVKLMTMHASKGLEFPVVFVTGLEERVFPHPRSMVDENQLEEERRLMYVAVTRAEKELYLTHANQRRGYQGITQCTPSRFLAEIPESLVMEL